MKVQYIFKTESVSMFLFLLIFVCFGLFFSVKAIITEVNLIKPENLTKGIIQKITPEAVYKYDLEILCEINSAPHTIKCSVPQSIGHILSGSIVPEFKKNETIPIYILVTGKKIKSVPAPYKIRSLLKTVCYALFCVFFLIQGLILLILCIKTKTKEEEVPISEIICSICSIIGFIFLGGGFVITFLIKTSTLGFLLFALGYILLVFPKTILKKEISVKGFTTTYDSSPGFFIFFTIIQIIVAVLLIGAYIAVAFHK